MKSVFIQLLTELYGEDNQFTSELQQFSIEKYGVELQNLSDSRFMLLVNSFTRTYIYSNGNEGDEDYFKNRVDYILATNYDNMSVWIELYEKKVFPFLTEYCMLNKKG